MVCVRFRVTRGERYAKALKERKLFAVAKPTERQRWRSVSAPRPAGCFARAGQLLNRAVQRVHHDSRRDRFRQDYGWFRWISGVDQHQRNPVASMAIELLGDVRRESSIITK